MKVTNKTAYATIGCDVQLTENDRLALGVELDKVTNWLETVDIPETSTELYKAINKIAAFISKFAIRPSETNVFTDSPEDFKKANETVDTDDEKIRNWLVGYFHQYKKDGMESYANGLKVDSIIAWLEKQESKADETTTAVEPVPAENYFRIWITVIPEEQSKELRNAKEHDVKFIVAKAMEASAPHLSSEEIHNYILGNLADEDQISWDMKTEEDFKRAIEILDKYGVKYKTGGMFVPSQMVKALKSKGSKALRSKEFDKTESNDNK
jgi:hypothetical protein